MIFVLCALLFYMLHILYLSKDINYTWGSLLQPIFYLGIFFFITAAIGLQFRDSFEQYNWKKSEENRPFKIREKLIDNGHVEVDLKINSIQTLIQKPEYPQNWQNAYYVEYETNKKIYVAFVDSNFSNILDVHLKDSNQSA